VQTYIGLSPSANGPMLALFKVQTRQGEVYMSVGRNESGNDERAVVEVRRDALLGLWRNEMPGTRVPLAARSSANSSLNEGLEVADVDFRLSKQSPVPITEVRYGVRSIKTQQRANETVVSNAGTQPFVSIVDGAERALWLASQGIPFFPIGCSVSEAPMIARLAGTRRSRWMKVSEMFSSWALEELTLAAAG
jgi:hypothetical protein